MCAWYKGLVRLKKKHISQGYWEGHKNCAHHSQRENVSETEKLTDVNEDILRHV